MKRFFILLAVITLAAVSITAFAQRAKDAEVLYHRGVQLEEVKGELKEAIAVYEKLLKEFVNVRPIAAQALLRMGICYEKLGQKESQAAYQRILRDFADQAEIVAQARVRLAALAGAAGAAGGSTMAVRRVWAGSDMDILWAVSPDGRFLSLADPKTGDLVVCELATGRTRRLTNGGRSAGRPSEASAFSPDGMHVAYLSQGGQGTELRIIGVDGSNPRVLQSGRYVPHAWSPDGKHVLTHFTRQDGTTEITSVSVADGSVRVLKRLNWSGPGKMCFSPDGHYIAYDVPPRQTAEERDIYLLPADGRPETPLVQHPANDRVLGWAPDGKSLLFFSDRTGTWDAWLVQVIDGRPQGLPELVKKDIGRIVPIGFSNTGSFYYGLSIPMQDVYVATLDPTLDQILTPPAPIAGRFVGANFAPDWSPDGKYLAYVARPVSRPGPHTIAIRSVESGEERELSPKMKSLGYNLRWSPDGRSMLVRGYDAQDRFGVYTIDVQTGEVMTAIPGAYWADWSRDGKAILCAKNARNSRPLVVRNLETGQDKEIFSGYAGLSVAVSPDGRWVAFSSIELDAQNPKTEWSAATLRIMPVTGGEARQVLRLQRPEDFAAIAWAPNGRQLLFVRRNLKENRFELWHVGVDGEEPRRILIGLAIGDICQISMHPDGRQVALNAGGSKAELWVLENFLPPQKVAK